MSTCLAACHCCGLIQQLPELREKEYAVCQRCATTLNHGTDTRHHWSIALALSGLIFYIPAMLLPMMSIERLGHRNEDSLLSGLGALFADGYWFIGMVVLLFSVILPFFKLLLLLILSRQDSIKAPHHRASLYHTVEFLGRWGMLDVMLMAVLVAFVKLGNLVSIHAGAGLIAFTFLVLCSLCASLTFNPHMMWQKSTEQN